MKISHYIIAIAVLMGLSSCSDFLDTPTDSRVDLSNDESLRMLMTSAYPSANYGWPCEISTDNLVDNNAPNMKGVRYKLDSYSRNDDEGFAWEDIKSESGSDSPSEIWESFYYSIATCNHVLQKVAELEKAGEITDKLLAVKGEALVTRAYSYFILANIFCMPYQGQEKNAAYPGIPYVTEPETTVKPHYERGNLAETYENIERDLLDGLALIDDGIYEVPKYHFNKQAAYAFASRFYLFKRDYEKVLNYANLAFGGENVDVTQYLSKIWAQSNLNYADEYARYYCNSSHARNFLLITTNSIIDRHLSGKHRYAVNGEAMRATLQGPGPTWERCEFWEDEEHTGTMSMFPAYAALWSNGGSEYGGWWAGSIGEQFEYTDKIAGIGYAHVVRCEFTGEEVLLNRAEAKLFLGDIDGCVADLGIWENNHRSSPYVESYGSGMIDWSKEAVENFYTKAEADYNYYLDSLYLGKEYQKKIYFGIARPINVDKVCPSAHQLTPEMMPFMQCVQHFRRMEFMHTGMRWFDIRRLGLSVKHVIGKESDVKILNPQVAEGILDPRLALQIPNEIIAAGITSNDRVTVKAQMSPKRCAPLEPYNE